jgi:hypothetical protein
MSAKIKGKHLKIVRAMVLSTMALCLFANKAMAANAIVFGMGQSTLTDSAAAMTAAASAAKTALGANTAKVVLGWISKGQEAAFKQLPTVFTTTTATNIFGIPGEDNFTISGRGQTAVVVALAGQINAAYAVAAHHNNYDSAGSNVAAALKTIQTGATDSKITILIGDDNCPLDQTVVDGFLSTLGNSTWVNGGSCGKVFANGNIDSASILGILLYGAFDCRFGMESGEDVPTAQKALDSAQNGATAPTFAMIFDCVSRYTNLSAGDGSGLVNEMNAIKQTYGTTTPFFGGYFLGEIGKLNMSSTAYGYGGCFSVTNFYSRVATTSVVPKSTPSVVSQHGITKLSGSTSQYRLNGSIVRSGNVQSAGMIVSKQGTQNVNANGEIMLGK